LAPSGQEGALGGRMRTALPACISTMRGRSPHIWQLRSSPLCRHWTGRGSGEVPWPLRRLGKRSVCADFESSVPVQSLSIRVNATTVLLMVWQNFVLLGNSGFGTRCCPPLCQIGAAFARQRASAVCVCSVVSCQYREALVVSCRCCGGTYSRMCKAQRSTALYNAHAWCSCSSSKCCP